MRVSKERSVFKKDLIENIKLYVDDVEYVENADKKVTVESLSVLSKLIESDVDWTDKYDIKQKIYDLSESVGIKMGKVMPALRFALLGGKSGPDLLTTAYIFGKEECRRRIEKIL
jgi:glutamyl/glutaminyl-tRNA synthetase